MKFKLEIEMGNDAMQDIRDVAVSLEALASRLRELYHDVLGGKGVTGGRILDVNGNIVGKWARTKS